jgi:ABC-type transporter Mla maintaining outer membrane lipid asymmetry ATPase subunit MlaF
MLHELRLDGKITENMDWRDEKEDHDTNWGIVFQAFSLWDSLYATKRLPGKNMLIP